MYGLKTSTLWDERWVFGYQSSNAICRKTCLKVSPKTITAIAITTPIKATRRPYSIALAPLLFFNKFGTDNYFLF